MCDDRYAISCCYHDDRTDDLLIEKLICQKMWWRRGESEEERVWLRLGRIGFNETLNYCLSRVRESNSTIVSFPLNMFINFSF